MAPKKSSVRKSDPNISIYRGRYPKELWKKFKDATPKSMTMNDALVDAMYKYLGLENPVKRTDILNNQPKKK